MSKTNDERKPLLLIPGYSITRDGRVFAANSGREIASMSLSNAKRAARADPEFDPTLCKRRGMPTATLVFGEVVEVLGGNAYREKHVRWVRLPTPAESNRDLCFDKGPDGKPALRQTHSDGRIDWFSLEGERADRPMLNCYLAGSSCRAVGNTSTGWYRLEPGGAAVLFHGKSVAAEYFRIS